MSVHELQDNKCRICLEENEDLDWNNLLSDNSHLTYKDCFYKYTQIECTNENHFSNMICYNCSNGLEYIETFISRAVEINSKLQDICAHGGLNYKEKTITPTDFDTLYVEEIEIKREEESSILYDEVNNLWLLEDINQKENEAANNINNGTPKLNERSDFRREIAEEENSEETTVQDVPIEEETVGTKDFCLLVRQLRKYYMDLSPSSSKRDKKKKTRKSITKTSNQKQLEEKCNLNKLGRIQPKEANENYFEMFGKGPSDPFAKLISYKISETKPIVPEDKPKEAKKSTENTFLCQYCSAEIRGWQRINEHEARHVQGKDRKRTATCAQCGVKFYDQRALSLHEKIHDKNREKRYKCEFCEKAFYNMGGLNVHRRIHLGLMVKCPICHKEFFRNVELYKHMNIHSSTIINVPVKKRTRYFVKCKHCSKKILSSSYKSHMAAHLNQPLVKCSICNKEYFNRESCRHHIRTIHKKEPETVNDFIVILKTDRLTHLYIKQNADIDSDEEKHK